MSDGKLLYQEAKEKLLEDKEFRNFIKAAIADGLESCAVCPVPPDMRENMSQWAHSIKTIGEGNVEKGIERMKKNHDFIHGMRLAQTAIGKWVMRFVVFGILAVIAGYLTKGIWGTSPPWK